jgi:hypothetical protein
MKKLKKMVKDWFNALATDFHGPDIQKLVTRYKCLNLHGDYVEKCIKVCSNDVKSKKKKKTPSLWSSNEICRPSDRRKLAK